MEQLIESFVLHRLPQNTHHCRVDEGGIHGQAGRREEWVDKEWICGVLVENSRYVGQRFESKFKFEFEFDN